MRFGLVRDLVAHARSQDELPAILKLGVQLALEAQEDMPFRTPVVSQVARGVLDHADPDAAELARAPIRDARLTLVLGSFNGRPVGDSKGVRPSACLPPCARRRVPAALRSGREAASASNNGQAVPFARCATSARLSIAI